VRFFLQGRQVPMAVGEAWYLNVNLPHSVENTGDSDRVHLVIDAIVNDWVRGLIADSEADAQGLVTTAEREEPGAARVAAAPPPGHTAAALPNDVTDRIIDFLRGIGVAVREGPLGEATFLPGIAIDGGALLVDRARLAFPGDLLHEAGHLAVTEPERRASMSGDVGGSPAEEMMAIAWSYAAGVALGIDSAVVLHDGGYKGGAHNLREAFDSGAYIGLPMLQWVGMALDATQAQARGLPAYPAMVHWLRPPASPSGADESA
jgi:hypothetical protein